MVLNITKIPTVNTSLNFQSTSQSQNNFGGYGSSQAQNQALAAAIQQSRRDNPEQFIDPKTGKEYAYVSQTIQRAQAQKPTSISQLPQQQKISIQPFNVNTQQRSQQGPVQPLKVVPTLQGSVNISKSKIQSQPQYYQQNQQQSRPQQQTYNEWSGNVPGQVTDKLLDVVGKPIVEMDKGIRNTAEDYYNIANLDYEDKALINRSAGKLFEGDFDEASKIITSNPARLAGELNVEIPLAIIPVGPALKGAKYAIQIGKKAIRYLVGNADVLAKATTTEKKALEKIADKWLLKNKKPTKTDINKVNTLNKKYTGKAAKYTNDEINKAENLIKNTPGTKIDEMKAVGYVKGLDGSIEKQMKKQLKPKYTNRYSKPENIKPGLIDNAFKGTGTGKKSNVFKSNKIQSNKEPLGSADPFDVKLPGGVKPSAIENTVLQLKEVIADPKSTKASKLSAQRVLEQMAKEGHISRGFSFGDSNALKGVGVAAGTIGGISLLPSIPEAEAFPGAAPLAKKIGSEVFDFGKLLFNTGVKGKEVSEHYADKAAADAAYAAKGGKTEHELLNVMKIVDKEGHQVINNPKVDWANVYKSVDAKIGPVAAGDTRLYRVENTKALPHGAETKTANDKAHNIITMYGQKDKGLMEAEGRWFNEDIRKAPWYLYERFPSTISVIDVPAKTAKKYTVGNMRKNLAQRTSKYNKDKANPIVYSRDPAEVFLPKEIAKQSQYVMGSDEFVKVVKKNKKNNILNKRNVGAATLGGIAGGMGAANIDKIGGTIQGVYASLTNPIPEASGFPGVGPIAKTIVKNAESTKKLWGKAGGKANYNKLQREKYAKNKPGEGHGSYDQARFNRLKSAGINVPETPSKVRTYKQTGKYSKNKPDRWANAYGIGTIGGAIAGAAKALEGFGQLPQAHADRGNSNLGSYSASYDIPQTKSNVTDAGIGGGGIDYMLENMNKFTTPFITSGNTTKNKKTDNVQRDFLSEQNAMIIQLDYNPATGAPRIDEAKSKNNIIDNQTNNKKQGQSGVVVTVTKGKYKQKPIYNKWGQRDFKAEAAAMAKAKAERGINAQYTPASKQSGKGPKSKDSKGNPISYSRASLSQKNNVNSSYINVNKKTIKSGGLTVTKISGNNFNPYNNFANPNFGQLPKQKPKLKGKSNKDKSKIKQVTSPYGNFANPNFSL